MHEANIITTTSPTSRLKDRCPLSSSQEEYLSR